MHGKGMSELDILETVGNKMIQKAVRFAEKTSTNGEERCHQADLQAAALQPP